MHSNKIATFEWFENFASWLFERMKSFFKICKAKQNTIKRFNKIFVKNNLVTMGELGGNPTKKDLVEYTTKKELDMIFSFEQLNVFNKKNKVNCNKLLETLKNKEGLSSKEGWSVLFWLNHDYPRLISKIKGESDPQSAQTMEVPKR